jgi:putative ABC transport system permease protein
VTIRPEITIAEAGPWFGTNEAIVGRAALKQFQGIDLGAEYSSKQLKLKVVGVFTANGLVAESEIWCDARVLQGAYKRGNSYQSVLAKLDSPASLETFKNWLTTNPQLNVTVKRENEYYAAQTEVMTGLINGIGYVIAILMGIAAVFGAILTMYTAVATRTREIATLRALGFNTFSVLVSILGESMTLAALGGVIGGLLAYVGFNGYETATMNFQTFSQVAFALPSRPPCWVRDCSLAADGIHRRTRAAIRAARLPFRRRSASSRIPLQPVQRIEQLEDVRLFGNLILFRPGNPAGPVDDKDRALEMPSSRITP